jgi:subfamily B ATP-binding cassette protein MsbA
VDFIRELFEPGQTTNQQIQDQPSTPLSNAEDAKNLLGLQSEGNLYDRVNQYIKDIIIQENRYDTLKIVCLIIFLSFLLKNISLYLKRVILTYVQLKIIVNIRNRLHDVMLHLPLKYFSKRHSGDLTSVLFNDVNAVNHVLKDSFGKLLLTPIQVASNLVILILISWKLSLITFTIVPLSGLLIVKIGQSIRRKSRRVLRRISEVVSVFQEAVTSIRIVKAFTSEKREYQKFESANDQYFKAQFRSNRLSFATSPLNETLGILILVALLWYGGNLVYKNAGLTAEDFIRYLVFLFTMFQPLKELSGLNNVIQSGLAAAERIFEVIESPQEVYDKPNAKQIGDFKESIVLKDVNFKYNESDPLVLKNINLKIKKGQTVAFVGHSGSGKTTLVNLIPRFYEVDNGQIIIDGENIKNYTLTSLRKLMGIVTQDTILFNDTIRTNIAYGLNSVDEDQIVMAAEAANALEFIKDTEKGFDTEIGEKGIKLSGGQKQRLSIARAILKNPPILILDEATSSLDTESEKLVQEAIDKLMKNRTVLAIAHRLSTIIHADQIVVINKGKITDVGTHRTLLESSSIYQHLYEIQFRDEHLIEE